MAVREDGGVGREWPCHERREVRALLSRKDRNSELVPQSPTFPPWARRASPGFKPLRKSRLPERDESEKHQPTPHPVPYQDWPLRDLVRSWLPPFAAVFVGRIAVDGVDVLRGIAAHALRRILNPNAGALDAEIRRAAGRGRTAPGKPRFFLSAAE